MAKVHSSRLPGRDLDVYLGDKRIEVVVGQHDRLGSVKEASELQPVDAGMLLRSIAQTHRRLAARERADFVRTICLGSPYSPSPQSIHGKIAEGDLKVPHSKQLEALSISLAALTRSHANVAAPYIGVPLRRYADTFAKPHESAGDLAGLELMIRHESRKVERVCPDVGLGSVHQER
jgi:hypothetical protein